MSNTMTTAEISSVLENAPTPSLFLGRIRPRLALPGRYDGSENLNESERTFFVAREPGMPPFLVCRVDDPHFNFRVPLEYEEMALRNVGIDPNLHRVWAVSTDSLESLEIVPAAAAEPKLYRMGPRATVQLPSATLEAIADLGDTDDAKTFFGVAVTSGESENIAIVASKDDPRSRGMNPISGYACGTEVASVFNPDSHLMWLVTTWAVEEVGSDSDSDFDTMTPDADPRVITFRVVDWDGDWDDRPETRGTDRVFTGVVDADGDYAAVVHKSDPRYFLMNPISHYGRSADVVREIFDGGTHRMWCFEPGRVEVITPEPQNSEPDAESDLLAILRRELALAKERHAEDIAMIGRRLRSEAEIRDWCVEFDDVVESLNIDLNVKLEERYQKYTVVRTFEVIETVEVNAKSQLDAEVSVESFGPPDLATLPRTVKSIEAHLKAGTEGYDPF